MGIGNSNQISNTKSNIIKISEIKNTMVQFKNTVEVIIFSRTLGGSVIPCEGLLTMCLNTEIARTTEPLIDREEQNIMPTEPYKSSQARAILLKRDMGEAQYKAQIAAHNKEMKAMKELREETANNSGNYRSMPSNAKQAVARAKKDETEVKKLWGSNKVKLIVVAENIKGLKSVLKHGSKASGRKSSRKSLGRVSAKKSTTLSRNTLSIANENLARNTVSSIDMDIDMGRISSRKTVQFDLGLGLSDGDMCNDSDTSMAKTNRTSRVSTPSNCKRKLPRDSFSKRVREPLDEMEWDEDDCIPTETKKARSAGISRKNSKMSL